uniref:Uncharacterized protein n=1 Tax=Anguilla anguilla TaxID=7936 RepID=A0A0E9RI73_ANGAN
MLRPSTALRGTAIAFPSGPSLQCILGGRRLCSCLIIPTLS